MEDMRGCLEAIARSRVYFGHHSVGDDLLRGCGLVARHLGVEPLPILHLESGRIESPPSRYLAEGRVGSNQDPDGKIADFRAQLSRLPKDVDAAFMKFCYVDFDPETDSAALFARYWRAMHEVANEHPHLRVFHVTTPLMTRDLGIKSRLKRVLGKTPYRDLANARRDEFNRLLRERCDPARLIDLALAESTRPDGRPVTVELDGVPRPYLLRAYARDAGHLNDIGAERCARALIRALGPGLAECHSGGRD